MSQRRELPDRMPPESRRGVLARLGPLLVTVAILALTGLIIAQAIQAGRATVGARLQAIAELKAYQIGDWLEERRKDAEFIQSSTYYATQYRQWRDDAQMASRELLLVRLERFVQARGFNAVMLLDPAGQLLWRSHEAPSSLSPELLRAALQASAEHAVGRIGPYQAEDGGVYLDYLAPLAHTRPSPVVVLHATLTSWLYPRLLAWPVPTSSGEALLIREDARQVQFLNAPCHNTEQASALSLALNSPQLLSAQVLRRATPFNALIRGQDYRGVAALGAARPIPGTDWRLLAKLDQGEIDAPALRQSTWIALAGLSLALGAWVAMRQRAQAQALLHKSREQLRLFIEHAPASLSMFDREMRHIAVSRRWLTDFGLTDTSIIGRSHYELFPDIPEHWRTVHQRALAGETIREEAERFVRQDGHVQWLRWEAQPWYDSQGRIGGIVIFTEDISARKEAEAARQAADLRLRHFVDANIVGVVTARFSGEILETNDYFLRLVGFTREEYEQGLVNWRTLTPPEWSLTDEQAEQTLDAQGVCPPYEKHYQRRDGSRVSVLLAHALVSRADEEILSFVLDLSPLKEAERAMQQLNETLEARVIERTGELRRSEARARAIIDASPVPFIISEGLERITYVNPAFTRTFGYVLEEIPTRNHWWTLAYPDADERQKALEMWQQRLEHSARSGEPVAPLELRVRARTGQTLTVLGSVISLGQAFDELALVSLYDVTELQQAREQAEQAAQAKSIFLAKMSHEIRTPMNGILGLAEVALHKTHDPEIGEDLRQIRQSANSLLGILNDILDQAKIEAGELHLERAPFDLEVLLETLRSVFGEVAAAKGLELSIRAAPAVPRALLGDALRLQQVLANLLSNAIKFTDQGRVRLMIEPLADDDSGVLLRWSVRDTGIGMDASTIARLFRPFSQGDESIARRFGGTGLGLSISRDLVELMGGCLNVTSDPAEGSCFAFELRLARSAEPSQSGESRSSATDELKGLRVLVAEDQSVNRRVIGKMLQLYGVEYQLASNGEEALARLAEAEYDMVLMDIQMPVMDGLSATRHIRANPDWSDLTVIALTAGVTELEQSRIRSAGLNDLLPKPVTLQSLKTMLMQWRRSA